MFLNVYIITLNNTVDKDKRRCKCIIISQGGFNPLVEQCERIGVNFLLILCL